MAAGLRELVLAFVPLRYWVAFKLRGIGRLQVWEIAASLSGELTGRLSPNRSRAGLLLSAALNASHAFRDPKLVLLPSGRVLFRDASGYGSEFLSVLDVPSGRCLHQFRSYTDVCAVSPDGEWVVVSRRGTGTAMWNPDSGDVRWRHPMLCRYAAFSPGGDLVALLDWDQVAVVDSGIGETKCRTAFWPGMVGDDTVAFSGHRLEVCVRSEKMRSVSFGVQYEAEGCALVGGRRNRTCEDLVISSGGAQPLLALDVAGTTITRVGDAEDQVIFEPKVNFPSRPEGRFSPRGRSVLFSMRNASWLWRFAAGHEPRQLPHGWWAFSGDDEVLVALGQAGLRLVDTASGAEVNVSIDAGLWPEIDSLTGGLAVSSLRH